MASQAELLDYIQFTETFEQLDTLTVSQELVNDVDKFFSLCEACVNTNFAKVPLEFSRVDGKFSCKQPIWFDSTKPTSLCEWILFFLERAMWI